MSAYGGSRVAGGVAGPFGRPSAGRTFTLQPHQVVSLGFLGLIAVGTVLLVLPVAVQPGKQVSFVDALFTAVSAVCVTGLTTVQTADTWSLFGQVVIMLLIQIGGLGIMTMSTLIALLLGKRITLPERLVIRESLGQLELAGVVRLTRAILLTALILEGLGALVLAWRWSGAYPPSQALYLGIFHSVSAFNNAGFDLFRASLTDFVADPVVNLVMAGLIILGGIGFVVIVDVLHYAVERRRGNHTARLSLHSKVVLIMSGGLLALGTLLILLWEYGNPATLGPLPFGQKLLAAFFQATVPRTAGFNTLPLASLTQATLFFMVMLMFVGASPGGTGGGVKTTAFSMVILAVLSTIRGKPDVEIFGRRLNREAVSRSLAIMAIALFWVTATVLVLDVTEQAPIFNIGYEVMSAFGTVGLSLGLTPHLTVAGKLIIALTMFIGRVGPLTLAVALARVQRRGREQPFRYPVDRIIVG